MVARTRKYLIIMKGHHIKMIKFTEKTHMKKLRISKYKTVYMKKDGGKYLIGMFEAGRNKSLDTERTIAQITAAKDALTKSDGKFYKHFGNHDDPTEMLTEMLQNDYHFDDDKDLINEIRSDDNSGAVTNLYGCIWETQMSFGYRIYDNDYLETVNSLVDEILKKQGHITELEDSMFLDSESSESSTCPICGNDDLSFNQSDYADGYVQHQFTCAMCGAVGSESEKMVFDGFYIDKIPDWYLAQQAAIVNATETEDA